MRKQLLLLKELQETESMIGKLKKEHDAVLTADNIRRLFEDVNGLQKNMDRLKKEREKLTMQYNRDELLLNSLQSQKQQLEKTLYGGTVRNNKEMLQMQEKIHQLQERMEQHESDMLGVIGTQDTLEQNIAEFDRKYTQLQYELKTKRQDNVESILRLTTEIKGLIAAKNNLRERISAGILAVYDELKRKQERAVVWLQGDICTGCRVAVSSNIIGAVREAGTLVYCETCGRLLIPNEPV